MAPQENILKWFHNRKISLSVASLVVVFAWTSWLAVNGLWLELPLILRHAPEQYTLPAYLVVIIQLANVGPLLFTLGYRFYPNIFKETHVIYGLLAFGGLCCFLLSFVWDKTTYIGGKEHSSALLTLTFFLAFVDCSSSVTFMPYMAHFKKNYMSSYFIGAGMSALIPALVALGQGTGSSSMSCPPALTNTSGSSANGTFSTAAPFNTTTVTPDTQQEESGPGFSVGAFFMFLFFMVICSILAFSALVFWPGAAGEKVPVPDASDAKERKKDEVRPLGALDGPVDHHEALEHELSVVDKDTHSKSSLVSDVYSTTVEDTNQNPILSMRGILFLLVLQGWLNALVNGVIPSIQPYACASYSNRVYHLTLILQAVANPAACFLYQWIELQHIPKIVGFSGLYSGLAIYVLAVAGSSPCPPMNGSAAGGVIMVLVNMAAMGLVSYLKLAISTVMRGQGRKALIWCGVSIQVGSLVGAVTMFFIVTVAKQFNAANPCAVCS